MNTPPITPSAAVKRIRSLGLRAAYEADYDEFVVKCCSDEAHFYYTDDAEDAILTAAAMKANTCQQGGRDR